MEKLVEAIKQLVEGRDDLAKEAYAIYKPLVDGIIVSKTRDVNHISYTLDFMLDFCFDDKMLQLYRRLCRYLWEIDPETTASYVEAFRERWDEEGKMFGHSKNSTE